MAAEKSSATPFFACYRPKKAPREPKSDKTAHRKLIYCYDVSGYRLKNENESCAHSRRRRFFQRHRILLLNMKAAISTSTRVDPRPDEGL